MPHRKIRKKIKSQIEKNLSKSLIIYVFISAAFIFGMHAIVEIAAVQLDAIKLDSLMSGNYIGWRLGTIVPTCAAIGLIIFNLNRKYRKWILTLSNGLNEAAKGNYEIHLDTSRAGAMVNVYNDFNDMCIALSVMKENMQNAVAEAQEANALKSHFIANMSHEIRTPINAVLGLDEMIIRESNEENIRKYAYDIKSAGKTLLSLINDVLDFSKIESGMMEIIPVEYDLISVINDLYSIFSFKAETKGLQLKIEAESSLPGVLYGDEIRIKQVLMNILSNAIKYTHKGEVIFSVQCEKRDENNIWLRFTVKDTGTGIKQEDMKKLYSPFERIDEEKNRTIEGTGLGMNIVTQLLNMMDSKIEVHSVYGYGSAFSFVIGQKAVDWKEMGGFAPINAATEYSKPHNCLIAPEARVLIVDDTEMNLTVMKGLLKPAKIKVETANGGQECLDMAAKKEYNMIFLDHRMPKMDGVETLHRLRAAESYKNTPIIALTANVIAGARKAYIKEGFTDYLSKPVDSVALEKIILMYLPKELVRLSELVDFNAGIRTCGSEEIFQDVLKKFFTLADNNITEIETYRKNNDFENYTIKVHALKSSAALIGAAKLSEMAGYLEECGDNGNTDEINKKTENLLEIYRQCRNETETYINSLDTKDENRLLMDEAYLREALITIGEFAEVFDFDSVDSTLKILDGYIIPKSFEETINRLKVFAAQVDRNSIMDLIKLI